jgi:hypothetical protein
LIDALVVYLAQIFLLLAIWSMVWKENPLYRFVQYSYVVVAASVFCISAIYAIINTAVLPLAGGNLLAAVPIIGGLLIFTNQLKRWYWVSRYSLFFVLGVGTALAVRGALSSSVMGQIMALFTILSSKDPFTVISGFVSLMLTLFTFIYFFFYFVHRSRALRGAQTVGRWGVMLWIGVGFAGVLFYNMVLFTYVVMWAFLLGPPTTGEPPFITGGSAIVLIAIVGILWYFAEKRFARTRAQGTAAP